jgi:hypothetical protein
LEKWQSHLVGKGGLEPPCIAAPDPKSGPSASSGTPPQVLYYSILPSLSQVKGEIDKKVVNPLAKTANLC